MHQIFHAASPGEIREIPPAFAAYLGCGQFGRIGVVGDGSCFFHSVCALTNRQNYLAASIEDQARIAHKFRCTFSRTLKRREIASGETFEDMRDGFCVPSKWANETMIKHASRVLNINLIFFDFVRGRAYCGVHGEETLRGSRERRVRGIEQPTAIFAWISHSHFEPIVRIDDAQTGQLTTLFEPSKSERDAETVRAVMERYDSGCKI